jgi:hypothetical protein
LGNVTGVTRRIREDGSTAEERAATWPSDHWLSAADDVMFRAIDVAAARADVFRWLCQLRVAPYSYDWIDNFGRRSPRVLTPGLDALEVGQRFMTIFELVEFEKNSHVTLRSRSRLFGDVVVTYRVSETPGSARSRLAVKLLVRHRRDVLGRVWSLLLPPGDLVMMREQLRTLARLAEQLALSRRVEAELT